MSEEEEEHQPADIHDEEETNEDLALATIIEPEEPGEGHEEDSSAKDHRSSDHRSSIHRSSDHLSSDHLSSDHLSSDHHPKHTHWMDDDDDHDHGEGWNDEWDSDEDEWYSDESEEEDESDEDEEEEEDEEDEEEEYDEEEEDEDEEEEEEEEEEDEEEDEEISLLRMNLVNSYLIKKGILKYLKKKNAYFQDRIYRTSVRKGMIIESELEKEHKKKSRKHKKKDKDLEEEDGSDNEEDVESIIDKLIKKKKSLDRVALPQQKDKKKSKLQKTFGETFSNEVKYQKIVRKIIRILQTQKLYEGQHVINLEKHGLRREEWREAHHKQLTSMLAKIRSASEEAIDSNTGKRMNRAETEQFCKEINAIHAKLCATMIKMYKCRRGLELSVKRLDESEIQGEGLQMLEYEQLRAENQTLKDKLSDRVKDVDNIKDKITHGIQILAHFRAKMYKINQQITEGVADLAETNVEVYASRDLTENFVKMYEKVKRDEQKLVVESGLLDNAVLLRDYEKTHFEVSAMKEERRKLLRELDQGAREIKEIRDKIHEMKTEYPAIRGSRQEIPRLRLQSKEIRKRTLFGDVVPSKTMIKTKAYLESKDSISKDN